MYWNKVRGQLLNEKDLRSRYVEDTKAAQKRKRSKEFLCIKIISFRTSTIMKLSW